MPHGSLVIPIPKSKVPSSPREPPMGAAQSLEASPPSSPEEHRPPPRPEPAWEAPRGATSRPSASVARHASPQRRVAWGTPQSARSRVAVAAASESQGARGAYRRELLQASAGARPASELAAATTSAAPAGRCAAMAGSPRHIRSGHHHGGGGEPGAGLRMTRQQMRYCLTLRRMLVAQRMARLLATSNPNPKPNPNPNPNPNPKP